MWCQHFQIKSSFSSEKTLAVESGTHFYRESVKVQRGIALKENYIAGRSWGSAKLFVLKNDKVIADVDVQSICWLYKFTHPPTPNHMHL